MSRNQLSIWCNLRSSFCDSSDAYTVIEIITIVYSGRGVNKNISAYNRKLVYEV